MFHYNRRTALVSRSILYLAAAITLVFLSSSALHVHVQAQTRGQAAPIERRQRDLRNVENSKELPPQKHPQMLISYRRIGEDLELLQETNSHLSEAVISSPALDYRQIRKYAAEVRKRAARLRIDLLLPEPEKTEKLKKSDEVFTSEDLKSAIDDLDALVKTFVENPILRQPAIFDVAHVSKDWNDLEEIIRLSEQVQKQAEALSKAAGKKP